MWQSQVITKIVKILICSSLLSLQTIVSAASFAERDEVKSFIKAMVAKHHFDANKLKQAFSTYESSAEILEKIAKPYEEKPWYAYRSLFITEKRIAGGKEFWQKYRTELLRAQKEFGVPAEVIVAILGVETSYNENTGKYPVLQALATLAFDYPKRAAFFRQELEEFLLLCKEENLPITAIKGSYAGAMGAPQFISSSYRHHAIDFARIGKRDLINNIPNAIGSVANYLKTHGWVADQGVAYLAKVKGNKYKKLQLADKKNPKVSLDLDTVKKHGIKINLNKTKGKLALLELAQQKHNEYWITTNNFYAITRYNHSSHYAMAVYQLSEEIRKAINQHGYKYKPNK